MFKNVATKIPLIAWDTSANTLKTGDASNLTAYVIKDGAAPAALTDTSATELDSTNFKGMYVFDVTAGETNATDLVFGGKSSTANIIIIPARYTTVDLSKLAVVDYGTAQAVGASTLQLTASSPAFGTNTCAGMIAVVIGGTNAPYPQANKVASNTSGTGGTLTFEHAFTVTPTGAATTYVLFAASADSALATAVATIATLQTMLTGAAWTAGAMVNVPSTKVRAGSCTTTGTTVTFTDSAITETGVNKHRGNFGRWTSGLNVGTPFRIIASVGTAVEVAPAMQNTITSGDAYDEFADGVAEVGAVNGQRVIGSGVSGNNWRPEGAVIS